MPQSLVIKGVFPGLVLAVLVAAAGALVAFGQAQLFGGVWVDGLVAAILLGAILRTATGLSARLEPGIRFASKTLLELAIVCLGASISLQVLATTGAPLILAIVLVVLLSLPISYALSRLFGLGDSMATLVACGNSICGNSAIMAAAPAIGASAAEVASSIAFTAALGVLVVVFLPLLQGLAGLSEWQYGVVAGLSVYAVPQVLAATLPVGAASAQIGILVKLVRVMMLGPVILGLSLLHGRKSGRKLRWSSAIPWFVLGFFVLVALRSADVLPPPAVETLGAGASVLTLVSMAGLGLSVDLRTVLASGGRVLAAGTASILALVLLGITAALVLGGA